MSLRDDWDFERLTRLDRTIVRSGLDHRQVAVLTTGARTVLVAGDERVFAEPGMTPATVTTKDWVRVGPEPFRPELLDDPAYADWLGNALVAPGADALGVAMEYVTAAPPEVDGSGLQYGGDAAYGTGSTDSGAGADFFAYLGRPWTWADGKSTVPDPRFFRQLDCSGFVRLVYGYRLGVPVFRVNTGVDGLPRSSWAMAIYSGVLVTAGMDETRPPTDLSELQAGDLVFFALHDAEPARISHVGIYLGVDVNGGQRFVSSRQTADGPTMGDAGGKSVLGGAFFGPRLRRVVRL